VLIRRTAPWSIPEREATSESVFFNRRDVLTGGFAGAAAIGASLMVAPGVARADDDPSAALYPARRNAAYVLDRDLTPEDVTSHYNNFYEYSTSKGVAAAAEALKTRPWSVKIDGMVDKPMEIAIDDLLKAMPLEERLYRHRCVEAWSMAIPWTGFPLKALVDYAKPASAAKYVRMETFLNPKMAPGQKQVWYPWPYVEGLTMAEAMNELAFLVTGAYGKPLGKVYGAPLRLATPWKYGFKSVKSIARISFVAERPKTMWEALQPSEYGFWANVNPQVAHPRWSQASEDVLGTNSRRPTLLFNGYAEQVASLYKGLESEALFM
jgi:sulfoxide reductase catalytic subunit YedY